MFILLLCSDPVFRPRNARESLESNLKRLNESENLFQSEESLKKSRPKFRREKELTPSGEGKERLRT